MRIYAFWGEPTRPQYLVSWSKLQHLLDDRTLTIHREYRKYFTEIEVNILIHGSEIPRISGVWITGVEEDEDRVRVRLNDGLHVCRR